MYDVFWYNVLSFGGKKKLVATDYTDVQTTNGFATRSLKNTAVCPNSPMYTEPPINFLHMGKI